MYNFGMDNTKIYHSQTIGLELPCKMCGKVRSYTNAEIKRGRPKDYCQPCSVKVYNASRVKQSKAERTEKQKQWYQRNKDRTANYYANYRHKIRLEMIEAYGNKCKHCGESDPIVLVLDHIENNAQQDRVKNNHSGGYKMYLFLKRNGWPQEGYQLLCHNCNFKKEYLRRKDAVKKRKSS